LKSVLSYSTDSPHHLQRGLGLECFQGAQSCQLESRL
jgi:hypothetical protein